MFVRVVKGSSKTYVLIVRSFRDKNGIPRQETVYNLGPVTDSTREQVTNLAKRIIASLKDEQIIIKGEDIIESSRHNWGIATIINKLWDKFDLDSQFKGVVSAKVDALKLMIADRFLSPSSKLSTYNKRHRYDGFGEVALQHIYRSLDYLADHQDDIKSHIFKKQRLLSSADVVFFDVTTLYFESQKADLIRDFGYSKDCKFNEVQIVLCLIIDYEGRPLTYELFPGNTFEGGTLIPTLNCLKEEFQINKLYIVADRGIGSQANLDAIKSAGFNYVVGAKLRSAGKSIQQQAIDPKGFCNLSNDDDIRSYKFIQNKSQSWVVLHSTKRALKDQADRQRLIDRASELLTKGSDIINKRGARKFIKSGKTDKKDCCLDLEKIKRDAQFDGYYAISFSEQTMSAHDITSAYHGLWQIEESFRTMKHFFEVRPIFHWTPKRIQGHILLNFMLLVIENFLLSVLKSYKDYDFSHDNIRTAIADLEYSILQIDNHQFVSYASQNNLQKVILSCLNIPLPKNHKIHM